MHAGLPVVFIRPLRAGRGFDVEVHHQPMVAGRSGYNTDLILIFLNQTSCFFSAKVSHVDVVAFTTTAPNFLTTILVTALRANRDRPRLRTSFRGAWRMIGDQG
jgi:hypothetical protein